MAALHVETFRETHGRFGAPSYELRERQWREAFARHYRDLEEGVTGLIPESTIAPLQDPPLLAEFAGVLAPLVGVKGGAGDAPNEVDMITGATISSRVVIEIINERVAALEGVLTP